MSHFRRLTFLFILTVSLFSLSSCADNSAETESESNGAFQNGYFIASENTVRFVDESVGGRGCTGTVICAQPGCRHTDATCQAWLEDVSVLEQYNGCLYAIQSDPDRGFYLTEKRLSDGQNRTIASWENTQIGNKWSIYFGGGLKISDGYALVVSEEAILTTQGLETVQEDKMITWRIDLETGDKTVVFDEDDTPRSFILNFYRNHVLVEYTSGDSELMTEDEFIAAYGENASYSRYELHETASELRLYDVNNGSYRVIASDGFVNHIDPLANNGTLSLYLVNDDLYIFDMETQESRILLTKEGIINYWILDNKAFIICEDGAYYDLEAPTRFYYASLDDGVLVPFDEENTGNMTFGLTSETENCFIGVYNDDFYWIKKEDFYADRYDKVY